MSKIKKTAALLLALLTILTFGLSFGAFAEDSENSSDESSSSVVESSSQEESSSKEEEKSSSSEEKKSSSSEEKSSSSEEKSSSSEEKSSSSEEKRSSSSSSEETYAQLLTDDLTGFSIGLSQPNDKLLMAARTISAEDAELSEVYQKLLGASKNKELICCYEVELGGVDDFEGKVTAMIPVDESIIGRDMVVLFYPEGALRVDSSNKNVTRAGAQPDGKSDSLSGHGVIKLSEMLKSGRKYYFAVCEFADFVPASGGIGILGIVAIIIAVMALASGGLLAFLWIRYNKNQAQAPKN